MLKIFAFIFSLVLVSAQDIKEDVSTVAPEIDVMMKGVETMPMLRGMDIDTGDEEGIKNIEGIAETVDSLGNSTIDAMGRELHSKCGNKKCGCNHNNCHYNGKGKENNYVNYGKGHSYVYQPSKKY